MKWILKNVTQETHHPFLNYFTLTYEVKKDDGTIKEYDYYMVSRHDKDHLLPVTHQYDKVDGVVIPLYYIDPKDKQIYFLFTRQFRPAMGTYLISFTAGLVDASDKDLKETVKREVKEEAGVEISDIEVLTSGGPTGSGLCDETNAVVLARIQSFGEKNLEEFEDIKTNLIPLAKVKEMLLLPQEYYFPMNVKVLLLYLLERFKTN